MTTRTLTTIVKPADLCIWILILDADSFHYSHGTCAPCRPTKSCNLPATPQQCRQQPLYPPILHPIGSRLAGRKLEPQSGLRKRCKFRMPVHGTRAKRSIGASSDWHASRHFLKRGSSTVSLFRLCLARRCCHYWLVIPGI